MDGVGTFSKTIVCLGSLSGAELANGVQFKYRPDEGNASYEMMAYTGNRVNLYVNNDIRISEQVPPNSFGIKVGWSFSSNAYGVSTDSIWRIRDLDLGGLSAIPTGGSPLGSVMGEAKIEYAVDGVAGLGVGSQYGELGYNSYLFPQYDPGTLAEFRSWHIIPLTARADFIHVYFWCDPPDWVGGGVFPQVDRVTVWALSGSDVAGSQRIGGGHG